MYPVPRTKEQLHAALEKSGQFNDCCFIHTLTKATEVSSYTQWRINTGLNEKPGDERCVPLKRAATYCCLVGTCQKLEQPPVLELDSQEARIARCKDCALYTLCCCSLICTPCVIGKVTGQICTAESQLDALKPKQQIMK